jgi:hypothetical protein
MVAILSIMPSIVSGSFTRLIAAFFGFDTIYSPLALHIHEDISDRTEVRYVLIGVFLDCIYLSTAALLNTTSSFGLIFLACLGGFAVICLGNMLIFSTGPWDKYFKTTNVGDTGRSVQYPYSRFMESTARFAIQLLLFPLNRAVRSVVANFSRLNPPKNAQYPQDTKAYVYQELQGERTIRLLRIQQKFPFQKVRCQFENAQIGESGPYEAISYVWVDPVRTSSILVDGGQLVITKGAYAIIHRRQSWRRDQLIWIDQVCINQDDSNEKASQVQMMEHIYKEAVRVTAYLGEATDAHLVQILLAKLHF